MFYAEDSEQFFGGESEYRDEIFAGSAGDELGSGWTVSEIGRDIAGIDNGGVIEGENDSAGTGEQAGTGEGNLDRPDTGQTEEEEETSILVAQADEKEEIVDILVSAIERLGEDNYVEALAGTAEESEVPASTDLASDNEPVYTIDDVYAVLEEIKTSCVSIQDENRSYHIGQDITGRMAVAGLFMILGGIVVHAFVGRIR